MAPRLRSQPIQLQDLAGPEWEGYSLRPWGNAKSMRLEIPDGYLLQASELLGIREDRQNLGFLQVRTRELEEKLKGSTASFTRDESQLLRVALEVLLREIPVQIGRRDSRVIPSMLIRKAFTENNR